MIHYQDAKNIRFSCAYLFRICIDGKYFLVKDEQGRNTYQPVGGVYKYTDDSFFDKTRAIQCMRFGSNSDLDYDLRIIVPRSHARRFYRWYQRETGRETQKNLYREFQEEILNRIESVDASAFDAITYRCLGTHIEESRMNEFDLQVRIADVVELIPTPQQSKIFSELMKRESSVYYYATKEDIYALGRTGGNQQQTISPHSYKILKEEEKRLKRNRHTGKVYKVQAEHPLEHQPDGQLPNIEKADISKEFTFISYNSLDKKCVWDYCSNNTPPLENIWIDKKVVSESWLKDVQAALNAPTCKKAILFVNKQYLHQSAACYEEAKIIVDNKIPHIVMLVNLDDAEIQKTIDMWIHNDAADKNKLRLFKTLFHYDDDTGHINVSMYDLSDAKREYALQSYRNLSS